MSEVTAKDIKIALAKKRRKHRKCEGGAKWVQKNCHFRKLTKQDIENGEGFDGASPGDRILSTEGMKQFEEKKRKYQAKLETIGFTYDFKGGLIWD